MALAKTSNEIIHIRNKFGGVYFKKDASGQHIQSMPRVIKYVRSELQKGGWGEGSPFMSAGISGFSGAAWLWLLPLLAAFAAAWAIFAVVNKFTTDTGEEKTISGYNWYIYYALAFPECERPPFWMPPHAPNELPQSIVTFQGWWHYEHKPEDWPYYAPSGYYWFGGYHNEQIYLKTDENDWFLWWNETNWALSKELGVIDPDTTFLSDGENIFDYYRNEEHKTYAHVYQGGGEFPD